MRCTIYQWLISGALDGGKPLGRSTRRHLERCERCRRFWQQSMELEAGLLEQVPQATPPQVYRPGLRIGPVLAATAGLAAAAVLVVAILLPHDGKTNPAKANSSSSLHMDVVAKALAPADSLAAVGELASAGMQAEMARLAEDFKAATGAMLTYLPINTAEKQ